jgi:hypothetical protein
MTEPINSSFAGEEVTAYAAMPEVKPIPDAPYRGVEPFRFIDQQIFVARETETWNLLSSIMIYRGVLLYGGSGTGKSSMINAGLIPKALNEKFLPNILRVQPRRGKEIKIERIPIEADGKPPYLPSTFAKDDSALSFECSIQDVHSTLKALDRSNPPDMRPMLIFDQFEEFITLFEEAAHASSSNGDGDAEDEAYKTQLAILEAVIDLIHDDTLPIKILFVFREDYLGKLSILFEGSPDLLDQYLRLKPPRVEMLQKIIRAPFMSKELSDGFAKGQRRPKGEELMKLADRIAAELAAHGDRGVNLSELQIVCRKLWESDKPTALFNQKDPIQKLIEGYWSDALEKFPGELYEPAVALLGHLITSSNTRNIVSEDDLLSDEKNNFPEKLLRDALDALVQSKLVRREPRYKLYFYEIVSEYLVPWIQRLKAERLAELERVKTRENLDRAEAQNRILQKWRRGLVTVSMLMLVAAVSLAVVYRRAKRAETAAKIAEASQRQARKTAEGLLNDLNRDKRIFQLLQDLTSTDVDERLKAIQDIGSLGKDIPQEAAKLLPAMVLADTDERVVKSGRELLSGLALSNPTLQAHANIQIEGKDNQDQKARADRINVALTPKGIFVEDYAFGKPAPSANLLKYCKISEGTLQPDEVLRLITNVDGANWQKSVIPDCEKSTAVPTNHYEIWFASDTRIALQDLVAIVKQWKDAKVSGNIGALQRAFADEFSNTDQDGIVYTKSQWIARLREAVGFLVSWKMAGPKIISFGGNTASLTFTIADTYADGSVKNSREIDTFVKRDGRWRVLASQSTPLK